MKHEAEIMETSFEAHGSPPDYIRKIILWTHDSFMNRNEIGVR